MIKTIREKARITNKEFNVDNMNSIISAYNNEKHKTTGYTPQEMYKDRNKEIDYIASKMNESDMKRNKAKNDLKPNDYVRVFNERNRFEKNQTVLKPNTYKVHEIDNNHVFLKGSNDGSFVRYPRYQILNDKSKVDKNKLDDNIQDERDIDSIDSYKRGKYKVIMKNGDIDMFTPRQLREGRPTMPTLAERDYWKNKRSNLINDYSYNFKYNRNIRTPQKVWKGY